MGSDKEMNDLKACYSSLKLEMKKSLDAIRIEEKKIEKLKNDFHKKISSSVETLVQNHHLFKKNLFIWLMKNPQVKNNNYRIRSVSIDSVEFSTSCFDSTREIRMKINSESGRRVDVNLRLYKNFFRSNISSKHSDLQNLVVSYLTSFEKLEQFSTLIPPKNSFTVEEYVQMCKNYNVAYLYDSWEVFSMVSSSGLSKEHFEEQVKNIKDEELVKKTIRELKR